MNGEHLSPKTRELLDRPMEERIVHIQKDSWIPYSQANRILHQLEDLLHHPKCDRMPNLAISAQTNNGKTRLMKHFLSLHPASDASGGKIAAPVFFLQCPGIPEESRLYSAILLKLCRKFRPSAPAQEKLVLVLDALAKIEIRIVALDEVNFTEAGTAGKQKRFLNALRYLANELRISIVCLGTEEMMRVIRSVASVENRFPPAILPRWQTDNEFRKLLASFEKIIPLKQPSDLQSSILTAKLLTRSEGTIGELKTLLAARDRLLERHPKLRVVGAHLGSMELDIDEIARHFDRYPNFAVDTAARMEYLMLQPREKVRDFLVKYQDRVLYGTDGVFQLYDSTANARKEWEGTYARDWKFLATEESLEYQGRKIQGLKLPVSVLRKIFHDNAVQWIPGVVPAAN